MGSSRNADSVSPVPVEVKVFEHGQSLPLPSYMTPGSAGMDLYAAVSQGVPVGPGKIVMVPTGLSVALPEGYEFQVRPRSGLAVKHGITVVNAPGTIDSDYRGEIKVGLINLGEAVFVIEPGMRVAQMVLSLAPRVSWRRVETLPPSHRGEGGFGSSGLNRP